MRRNIIFLIFAVIASILILGTFNRGAGAQSGENLSQVLKNQELILQKLDEIDTKLDVIKMRIRQ